MAVLIDDNTKVICQGSTGSQNTFVGAQGDAANSFEGGVQAHARAARG